MQKTNKKQFSVEKVIKWKGYNIFFDSWINTKINEVENKIPHITNLATTAALTAHENTIPNVSNLVKKTDHNTKISEIEYEITIYHDHDKYITTQEFNKLTSEKLTARLAQANLSSKSDIANCVKNTDLDDKLKNLNTKNTSNKRNTCLLKMNLKNYRHLTRSLLTFGIWHLKSFYWSKLLF